MVWTINWDAALRITIKTSKSLHFASYSLVNFRSFDIRSHSLPFANIWFCYFWPRIGHLKMEGIENQSRKILKR